MCSPTGRGGRDRSRHPCRHGRARPARRSESRFSGVAILIRAARLVPSGARPGSSARLRVHPMTSPGCPTRRRASRLLAPFGPERTPLACAPHERAALATRSRAPPGRMNSPSRAVAAVAFVPGPLQLAAARPLVERFARVLDQCRRRHRDLGPGSAAAAWNGRSTRRRAPCSCVRFSRCSRRATIPAGRSRRGLRSERPVDTPLGLVPRVMGGPDSLGVGQARRVLYSAGLAVDVPLGSSSRRRRWGECASTAVRRLGGRPHFVHTSVRTRRARARAAGDSPWPAVVATSDGYPSRREACPVLEFRPRSARRSLLVSGRRRPSSPGLEQTEPTVQRWRDVAYRGRDPR